MGGKPYNAKEIQEIMKYTAEMGTDWDAISKRLTRLTGAPQRSSRGVKYIYYTILNKGRRQYCPQRRKRRCSGRPHLRERSSSSSPVPPPVEQPDILPPIPFQVFIEQTPLKCPPEWTSSSFSTSENHILPLSPLSPPQVGQQVLFTPQQEYTPPFSPQVGQQFLFIPQQEYTPPTPPQVGQQFLFAPQQGYTPPSPSQVGQPFLFTPQQEYTGQQEYTPPSLPQVEQQFLCTPQQEYLPCFPVTIPETPVTPPFETIEEFCQNWPEVQSLDELTLSEQASTDIQQLVKLS